MNIERRGRPKRYCRKGHPRYPRPTNPKVYYCPICDREEALARYYKRKEREGKERV